MEKSEQIRREQELEIKRQEVFLNELREKVKQQDADHIKLQLQIKRLTPFEPKFVSAEEERVDLKERLEQV